MELPTLMSLCQMQEVLHGLVFVKVQSSRKCKTFLPSLRQGSRRTGAARQMCRRPSRPTLECPWVPISNLWELPVSGAGFLCTLSSCFGYVLGLGQLSKFCIFDFWGRRSRIDVFSTNARVTILTGSGPPEMKFRMK